MKAPEETCHLQVKHYLNRLQHAVTRREKIELHSRLADWYGRHKLYREQARHLTQVVTLQKQRERRRVTPSSLPTREHLQERNGLFRLISEQAVVGVSIIQNDIIQYINSALLNMFGLTPEEVRTWSPGEFQKTYHPEDRDFLRIQNIKKQRGDKDVAHSYQARFLHKSGQVIWAQILSRTVTYRGKPALFMMLLDITATKQLEESLVFARTSLAGISDLLCWVDRYGKFYHASDTFLMRLGYTRNQLQDLKIHDIDMLHQPQTYNRLWQDLHDRRTLITESRYKCRSGQELPMELSVQLVNLDKNEYICFFARDISIRKLAARALEESERKYRELFQLTREGIVHTDMDGIITDANPAFFRLLGYTHHQLQGTNIKELVPDPWSAVLHGSFKQGGLLNQPTEQELEFKAQDGRLVPVAISLVQAFDKSNEQIGYWSVVHDLSELKKNQNILLKAYQKLELSVQAGNLYLWEWNIPTRKVHNITNVLQDLGYDTGMMSDTSEVWMQLVHPDDRENARKQMIMHLRGKSGQYECEYRVRSAAGDWVWHLSKGRAVERDADGRVISMAGVQMNIDARKNADQILREKEERYSLVVEKTGQVIYDYNIATGRITWAGAVAQLTGYTPAEFENTDIEGWVNMVHPEDRDRYISNLEHSLAHSIQFIMEYRLLKKDGTQVYLQDNGGFLLDESGKCRRLLGTQNDITPRRKAEESLKSIISRMHRQQLAVSALTTAETVNRGDFDAAMHEIANAAAALFEPDRLGIWLSDGTNINCTLLLVSGKQVEPDKPATLESMQIELQGIFANHYLAVDDVPSSDILRDSSHDYLGERGVKSVLYAALRNGEELLGLLTVAHTAKKHHWEADEIAFVQQMGDQISLAYLNHEKRLASEAMRENRRFLETLLTNLPGMVYRSLPDEKWTKLFISQGCKELAGYEPEQFLHNKEVSFADLIDKDQRERLRGKWAAVLLRQQVFRDEYTITTATGAKKWVNERGRGVFNKSGELVALEGFITDVTERKLAELELTRSEEKFRLLAENIPGGIFICNHDDILSLVYLNQGFETITGFAKDDYLSGEKGLSQLFQHSFKTELELIITQAVEERCNFHFVTRIRHSYGGWLWAEFFGIPVFREENQVLLEGMFLDITGRQTAREALEKSESRYRSVVDNAQEAIIVVQKGLIKYANPKAYEISGWSPGQVLDHNLLDFLHPDDRMRAFTAINRSPQNPRHSERHIFKSLHADGSVHHLEVSSSQFIWEGAPATLNFYSDITQRIQMEEELKKSEVLYYSTINAISDYIHVVDDGLKIILANNSLIEACQQIGYPGNPVGEHLSKALPVLIPNQMDEYSEVFQIGSEYNHEHLVEINDHKMVIDIKILPIFDRNRVVRVVTLIRDITQRRQQEESLHEHQIQLAQAEKLALLGTLVSSVAHEINNPNNFILLNAEILIKTWSDTLTLLDERYNLQGEFNLGGIPYSEFRGEVHGILGGILEGSQRIMKLVADLKDFARKDEPVVHEAVDVNQVIHSSLTLLSGQIKKSTNNFALDLAASLSPVTGSHQKLEQVIINLVQNSCQALTDKVQGINIATRQDGGHIIITVHDEGCGIADEHLDKIREPFFTTKRDSGGTGLGLSISYKIISEMRGKIVITSSPGAGTTVTVTLPVGGLE